MNSYSEVELKKFDQWVRNRLEDCKGNDDCYEFVWEQILEKIGDPSRKVQGFGFTNRMSGFLSGAHKIFPGMFGGQRTS